MAIADLLTTLMFAWASLIENLYQNYVLGPIFCKIETSAKAFMVYIPLFIMTFSYCLVIAKMKNFENKISTDENSIKIKHRRKVILMLFIYLITSAICWSPLQVIVFYRFIAFKSVDSVKPWNEEAKFWAQVFASANSALNPLIYGITNGSFRKAICLLYPKLSWFLRLDSSSSRSRRVTNGNGHNGNVGGAYGQTRDRDLVKSTFTMSNCDKRLAININSNSI
ncbi:G-protein coupled receptor 54-like [Panonychus citri]|uniref:G-protein coupled receptor 54-like n=1 Tax=Panonychus citri TaxID=50023 RepID=UPI002307E506|nr:G-protein coupled receptor 54-like [Panonychus citri]